MVTKKKKIAKTRKFNGKVYRRHAGVYMEKRQAQSGADRQRRSGYNARVVPVRVKGRTATWTGWLVYKRRRG